MDLLIIVKCLNKTLVTKYCSGKKPTEVYLSFRKETFEIICSTKNFNVKQSKGNVEESVPLTEVKEIRPGKNSKDFEGPEGKKCDVTKCFVIFYGVDFRLKTLSVATNSVEDYENWIKGIRLVNTYPLTYSQKLEIWSIRAFDCICNGGQLTIKHCLSLCNKINRKITSGRLQELLEKHGDVCGAGLDSIGFLSLLNELLYDPNPKMQIFTDCFGQYSLKSEKLAKEGLVEFLIHQQKELDKSDIGKALDQNFMKDYFKFVQTPGESYMTIDKAIDYLFSKENQVWDIRYENVYQDMTRPLSHYWIASSHNTYLTGDQLSSESSVEAYARCLRQGCRCIELDVFDGSESDGGLPLIYHQRTLVTKIPFMDVLYSIRDNAFATSEYPVILSIENHCSVKQQKVMAKKFQEVFGDMLVCKRLNEKENELPSPDKLKRRILLKGKIHDRSNEESDRNSSGSNDDPLELGSSLKHVQKTGKMYIQNSSSHWKPYFFALKNNKLSYIEMERERLESDNSSYDEPHLKKKWFHGDVAGGALEGRRRVMEMNHEGCFLVRNSNAFAGEYSIDFLSQREGHHIRICSKHDENGQRLFYLDPATTFDSVYTLITYYRRNPYETSAFRIERFTKAVPPPQTMAHESEQWFYKDIERTGAEVVLQNIPITGAFLVRYAHEGSRFAISFRYEQMIKHCRVQEDGRFLMVSTKTFENITDLVQYYQKHNFYKGIRLEQPVTEDLYRSSQTLQKTGVTVYTHAGYYDTSNTKKVTVRALHSYAAGDTEHELTFKNDDIITNVQKQGGGWWKGDLGDEREKWFPRDYVEEMDVLESPFGALQTGAVDLGKVEIVCNSTENTECPFILKIYGSPVPFRVAVSTRREAEEWEKAINATLKPTPKRSEIFKSRKREKKSKIAKELGQLIVYAKSISKVVPTEVLENGRLYYSLASFDEIKAEKAMSADPSFFVWLHQVQLSRIYPQGRRVDSSNFNPVRFWNFGCQMTALNYQTPDKCLQLNQAKFRENGNCGYVLKPSFMLENKFNPTDKNCLETFGILPIMLKLTVIAGRHLLKPDKQKGIKGIITPFVEIEILGAPFDCKKVQTIASDDNGLNPYWKQKFEFQVFNPKLALLRFAVQHEDTFGDPIFIAHGTYPVRCLRQGYRSVPLLNGFGEDLLSTLLVHLRIERIDNPKK